MVFSLVIGLSSAASATGSPAAVVRRLRRYYANVRLLADVHARITLLASRSGPAPIGPGHRRGLSVPARAISWLAYGSPTTPDPQKLAFALLWVLPVRCNHAVGIRNSFFEAQFLTRQCLCLRFKRTSRCPAQDPRSRWVVTPLAGLSSSIARRFIPTLSTAQVLSTGRMNILTLRD